MKPRVKELTSGDTELLRMCAELEKRCIPEPWSYESFLSETEKSGGLVLAALDENDDVQGFVTACCVLDEAELTNVAVSPECRRRGIAGQLLEWLFEELGDGVNIFLEVRESNQAAIALYLKYGFEQIGVRKRFYSHPEEDAVLMSRRTDNGE